MKLFVDFWKITKIWKGLQHRNTELFLFWLLDVQNNFMFPTCKKSQKRIKNQKSTDKHLSFDGLIQEDIYLSDIYLVVLNLRTKPSFKYSLFIELLFLLLSHLETWVFTKHNLTFLLLMKIWKNTLNSRMLVQNWRNFHCCPM